MEMSAMYEIRQVHDDEALDQVRLLFSEYWDSFGFTPCFQNFGEELAALPGCYSPPSGRLALARAYGKPAGCIALRRVDADRAELKRLYVRSECRGLGLGRALVDWIIDQARCAGYKQLIGDSLAVMDTALKLYRQIGFEMSAPREQDGKIDLRLVL